MLEANPSPDDLTRIKTTITGARADASCELYGTGLLVFHIFCNSKDITEAQRAPAPPVLINTFI